MGVSPHTIFAWRRSRKIPSVQELRAKKIKDLYEKGLSDTEIAERIGVERSTITKWRQRRDLSPNRVWGKERKDYPRRRKLYGEGLSDREIADEVGEAKRVICSWRKTRGLPANRKVGRSLRLKEEKKRRRLYEDGLSDSEIAERVGVTRKAIGSWRRRRGLVANSAKK